jgi:hypothetical protein
MIQQQQQQGHKPAGRSPAAALPRRRVTTTMRAAGGGEALARTGGRGHDRRRAAAILRHSCRQRAPHVRRVDSPLPPPDASPAQPASQCGSRCGLLRCAVRRLACARQLGHNPVAHGSRRALLPGLFAPMPSLRVRFLVRPVLEAVQHAQGACVSPHKRPPMLVSLGWCTTLYSSLVPYPAGLCFARPLFRDLLHPLQQRQRRRRRRRGGGGRQGWGRRRGAGGLTRKTRTWRT